tara:strand:- start:1134 stop:2462 length:1329 start_codon:yes stop_codon:yes gene_type:complete
MASTYLEKTFSGTPTNNKKCTISIWCKKTKNGSETVLLTQKISSARDGLRFDGSGDKLRLFLNNANEADLVTNRVFRDPNAFYHIVVSIDTTQATSSDRVKFYINGVQETSFSTETYPSQNYVLGFGNTTLCNVGRDASDTTGHFDGVMSHIHFIDGTAYDASAFGETDSTTGEWKIKTSPSVTYGTNGYFILKDGNSGTDQSPNSNDFAVGGGTLTNTEDCPSNVFATFNPLHNTSATMSNGNLTAQSTNSNYISGVSTLGTKTGKFYAEFKLIAEGASGESVIGVTALVRPTSAIVGQTGNFGIRNNSGLNYYTSGGTAYTGTSQHDNFTVNDIIGVALDMDNGKVYFSKNGGWWNGASTWTGTSPSTYVTLQTDIYDEFFFECGDAAAGQNANWSANFGNGYFGTTAISSEGTNASGIGKFEYDVPTGYTALSTKGLNE